MAENSGVAYLVIRWAGYAGEDGPCSRLFGSLVALQKCQRLMLVLHESGVDNLSQLGSLASFVGDWEAMADDGYLQILQCKWAEQVVSGEDVGVWEDVPYSKVLLNLHSSD